MHSNTNVLREQLTVHKQSKTGRLGAPEVDGEVCDLDARSHVRCCGRRLRQKEKKEQ
jgi:hypothetical protein